MPRPFLPEGLVKEKKLEVRVSEAELKAIRNFAHFLYLAPYNPYTNPLVLGFEVLKPSSSGET